jgi:thioredoxin 1
MSINCIFNKAHEEDVLRCDIAIIYFSAKWCEPCKSFTPVYSHIADQYKNLKFFKVDIDECDDFTDRFNIRSVPTIIILQNGEKINEVVGVNENKLLTILQAL